MHVKGVTALVEQNQLLLELKTRGKVRMPSKNIINSLFFPFGRVFRFCNRKWMEIENKPDACKKDAGLFGSQQYELKLREGIKDHLD